MQETIKGILSKVVVEIVVLRDIMPKTVIFYKNCRNILVSFNSSCNWRNKIKGKMKEEELMIKEKLLFVP